MFIAVEIQFSLCAVRRGGTQLGWYPRIIVPPLRTTQERLDLTAINIALLRSETHGFKLGSRF